MENHHITVTAEQFWEAFAGCLGAALDRRPDWRGLYSSNKTWTALVRDVVRETCGTWRFGLVPGSYTLEDFRIDFCCFSFSPLERCAERQNWDLEVAVEHENNSREWLHEWVKLAHLNCGLRVLISYADAPRDLSPSSEVLDRAARLAQARRYAPRGGSWLLILGPTLNALERGEDFVAFAFDGSTFRLLGDHEVFRRPPALR